MDANTLAEVESLANQLYGGQTTNEARAEAERQLSVLSTNFEMLEHVRQILERSEVPFAQHLAATSITKQLATNWGRFSAQQRLDMRNFVLTYLANKGPSVQVRQRNAVSISSSTPPQTLFSLFCVHYSFFLDTSCHSWSALSPCATKTNDPHHHCSCLDQHCTTHTRPMQPSYSLVCAPCHISSC